MAIDNLNSMDVVTADGQLRHASLRENRFDWGLRGGSGNFGVVTNLCSTSVSDSSARSSRKVTSPNREGTRPANDVRGLREKTAPDDFISISSSCYSRAVLQECVAQLEVCCSGAAGDAERAPGADPKIGALRAGDG